MDNLARQLRLALFDTLLVATMFLVVMHTSSLHSGAPYVPDYGRIAVAVAVFALITFVLRCTKKGMAHILVNALYFHLGLIFSQQFLR